MEFIVLFYYFLLLFFFVGFCFILAKRGFSSAKKVLVIHLWGLGGVQFCFVIPLCLVGTYHFGAVLIAGIFGAGIGGGIAFRSPKAALPRCIAVFHSLVGLAAALVAGFMFVFPRTFLMGPKSGSLAYLTLLIIGIFAIVGAITFIGSFIVFAKLQGFVKGAQSTLKVQTFLNTIMELLILGALVGFVITGQSLFLFTLISLSLYLGTSLILSIVDNKPGLLSFPYWGWVAASTGFILNSCPIILGVLLGLSHCYRNNTAFFSPLVVLVLVFINIFGGMFSTQRLLNTLEKNEL